jgi:hypothetical protein
MKLNKDVKTVDVMFRTAMLTQGYINEYFAKNNKALELKDFMRIQDKSFREAQKASDKNE